ncbi:hypothetical protein CN571_31300 [Bacillus pseudomycoides]|uniref:Uncharacterized protein n=1 Tax=Bacillus pseudomycoides TaxID=64104 RepID=A0ABD6SW07_9BACI|nr:hypothetical protein CON86_30035 [Bacillus pseudomycoides]PEM74734.1 hypothetical protein CN632_17395 [Bacillus pseudomycoides]PEO73237.1 hypothetical protein CN571_31300 [Bacillus pseudomycoides]PHC76550.1 hypothetical protein COF63_29720 [Bacillus pseudomycoides]PHE82243.1 hypothetical protein COF81_31560 [Bacillus pseudomycoides]
MALPLTDIKMIRLFSLKIHKHYRNMSVYKQTKLFYVYFYSKEIGSVNNNKKMGIPPTKSCKKNGTSTEKMLS